MPLCGRVLLLGVGITVALSAQITANCGHPDPTNDKQVFACMSSYRYGGLTTGRNAFENMTMTSCLDATINYRAALTKSGLSLPEASDLVPSCDVLGRGLEAITGKPTFWTACTHYPGHFDPTHMKACLDRFLPGYYGGHKTFASLNGCAEVTRQYELALRAASQTRMGLNYQSTLPPNYEKPDCAVVASMLGGQGSTCLNYEPTVPHLQTCLGSETDRFTACIPLRERYEEKLRQAYGGSLPPNYGMLACDQLAGLVSANLARQEAAHAAANARLRERMARPSSSYGGLSWRAQLWSWLGLPFVAALLVHGALALWSLYYASQQIRSGRWQVFGQSLTAVIDAHLFRWKLLALHGVLLLLGWWLTRWSWIVGALLVVPVSRLALTVLVTFGLFTGPRRRPGPIEMDGVRVSGRTEPGHREEKDEGVSEDWKL